MRYLTSDPIERDKAFEYLTELAAKEVEVEVKRVSRTRSLRQNAYLHLLIGYFGVHFGYTIEEAKIVYKEMNLQVYQYFKKGRTFLRSSAELTSEEMAQTIDRFREQSKGAGCPLPAATDQGWLREIENEIERAKYYL